MVRNIFTPACFWNKEDYDDDLDMDDVEKLFSISNDTSQSKSPASKVKCLDYKILDKSGNLNVEKTNARKLNDIKEKGFIPFNKYEGEYFFRDISTGDDGVLNVAYIQQIPDSMVLFPGESIRKIDAASLLDVSRRTIEDMLGEGKFRLSKPREKCDIQIDASSFYDVLKQYKNRN